LSEEILKRITNFSTRKELEDHLVTELLADIAQAGLLLLPVGATYEEGIYSKLNEELYAKDDLIHPKLFVSHLDELILEDSELEGEEKNSSLIKNPTLFSEILKNSLPNLIDKLGERFYSIDPNHPEDFERFIHQRGGARVIYLGLGADPSTAHVAFIGEDYINREISTVELAELSSSKLGVKQAVTIGTDVFKTPSLTKIVITIIGEEKAEAFKAAMENPDTGLGYLLNNHLENLHIFCDHLFAQGLKKLGVML
jgi:6-phosphogluconolactonase/glucosamine-6-phosphate isomerase/deaminase